MGFSGDTGEDLSTKQSDWMSTASPGNNFNRKTGKFSNESQSGQIEWENNVQMIL